LQQSVFAAVVKLEAGHGLRVAAIEAFREAQHRRQTADATPSLPLEVAVPFVAALRRSLSMIARNQRDVFDFLGVESA